MKRSLFSTTKAFTSPILSNSLLLHKPSHHFTCPPTINTITPIFQTQQRNIIQLKSILQVQDNCGAIEVECVTVPKTKRGHARVGSLIVVVVKKARPNRKVKKKQVCRAIVTQTRYNVQRDSGITYSSGENRCVIVDHKMAPVGTRIFGSLPVELRGQKYAKILSMAGAVF